MRLFIVGQKWLAREVLRECLERGHDIVGVAAPCVEDGLSRLAGDHGIKVAIAPKRLEACHLPCWVDLLVCAHAHCYITAEARDQASIGAIGFHPSLLPRHRGRDAIRWAIHMREPITGGTVYWMDDGVDSGPIARQGWCHVRPGDDAASLWRRELGPMGVRLLLETIEAIVRGEMPAEAQDEALATWEPGFKAPSLSALL